MQFNLKNLFKFWNKTSGIIMFYSNKDFLPHFIEIKYLFLFKLITYLFKDIKFFENYSFVYLNDWVKINRLVEMKNSEDEVVVELLCELIKQEYYEKEKNNNSC